MEQALERFYSGLAKGHRLRPMPAKSASLTAPGGRRTAEPIWAANSSPHYDGQPWTGSVRAADTVGAPKLRRLP